MKINYEKYLSADLVRFLFPLFLSLLTFCIYSYYTQTKLFEKTSIEFTKYQDSTLRNLGNGSKLEEKTANIMKGSAERNLAEMKVFLLISKKGKISLDSLTKGIPPFLAHIKLVISKDIGELNEFSNVNFNFGGLNSFNNCESLLTSELDFVKKLESYYEFKISQSSADISDESIFRDVQNSSLVLYQKISEIGNRLKQDKIDSIFQTSKQENTRIDNLYLSKLKEIEFLVYASLIGMIISFPPLVFLIYALLKYNLLGKNIPVEKRRKSKNSR
jgi:hypothetical protein